MKTFLTRGVALLLAVLMVFTVCGCKPDGDKEKTVFEPLPGEVPKDLDGYEFTVLATGGAANWNGEVSGTPYADAFIQMVDEVEYLYNCEISAEAVSWQDMFNKVQPEVMAGGKCADIIISHEHAYGQLLGANLMIDLNELTEVNWDNEWWNQSIRKTTSYNGKSYAGGASFIFDTNKTWLVYVNRAIWDQYGFEDPYALVDSGRWTYDVFREYAITAAKDNDGSGKLDSSEDVFGVIAANGDFNAAWFQAMGGHYFQANKETGKVELACNTSRTYTIVEKMYQLVQKDNVYGCLGTGDGDSAQLKQFVSGGALFYCYMVGKDGLQDMEDDWFVLPMPKLDEAQEEYLSGVDHNAFVFGVTNTNEDLREVGIVLEALGRHGMILEDIFWPDYKDTYWRDTESERIVSDYVVGHGQHDLALIMAKCNSAFAQPRTQMYYMVFGGNMGSDYASFIDAYESSIESTVQDFFGY